MKLLKSIKHQELFPEEILGEIKKYEKRQAARAIVFDVEEKIAILKVANKNYHKLPGGGVEEGENLQIALEREMLEEIGSKVLVTGEVGRILEYRDRWNLENESFCYLAKVDGEKGQPDFTEGEKENGFKLIWISVEEAIEKIKSDKPIDYEGKFIQVRDLCFLENIN